MNRKDIFDGVMVCVEKANSLYAGLNLQVPLVDFYHRGRSAGKAYHSGDRVAFNEVLAAENSETFIETIMHEVAHLVVFKLFPFAKAHGNEFKRVLITLGGTGKRCHSYNTASVRQVKTKTRYEYKCGCTTHKLTVGMHKKVRSGCYFTCKMCRQSLYATGKVFKII